MLILYAARYTKKINILRHITFSKTANGDFGVFLVRIDIGGIDILINK